METLIRGALTPPPDTSAKRKKWEPPDPEVLKEEWLARDSIPRGVMKDTVASLRDLYGCGAELSSDRVDTKLNSTGGKNVDRWRENVSAEFDELWSGAVDVPMDPRKKELPQELRTCSVTLKQIMRSDMSVHFDTFKSIAHKRQVELTSVVREVAALAQKTILIVSEEHTWSQPLVIR